MKETLFSNYQSVKLDISNPNIVNSLILGIFFLLALLSLRKCKNASGAILDIEQTEQLKGLAIFFVVLGHLWVHVSKTRPAFVLSGEAVAVFLILSGFGLALSSRNKKYGFIEFFSKRAWRIFPPYLITTFIVIVMDYALLDRRLGIKNVILTIMGINLTPELYFLDYVRWFVTFILFWYLLFYFCNKWFQGCSLIYSLATIAFSLFLLNYYYLHFSWYQFFAFPLGCALGVYYNRIKLLYQEKRYYFYATAFTGIAYIMLDRVLQNYTANSFSLYNILPTIVLALWEEINSLIFCISAIGVFAWIGEKRYNSVLLSKLGKYSYQIFLIHGIILVKYNPVIKSTISLYTAMEFVLFFGIVTGLSVMLSKLQFRERLRY
jgi:peptidoglycan/LPS O-acetylase OafA/YrhL